MKSKLVAIMVCSLCSVAALGQLLSLSLRSNNQQLVEQALEGAFIEIRQAYELCDTASGERFGRKGMDYFSVICFPGVATEQGLLYPADALQPWDSDHDFEAYRGKYSPLLSASMIGEINRPDSVFERRDLHAMAGRQLKGDLRLCPECNSSYGGLKTDSVAGRKEGWMLWLSHHQAPNEGDSIGITVQYKRLEASADGSPVPMERPDLSGNILGGIYVTSLKKSIGQLEFLLTGVLVPENGDWILEFPFIGNLPSASNDEEAEQGLTRIERSEDKESRSIIPKKKRK